MMEVTGFRASVGMTGLTVVVLARQTTGVAIRTGQAVGCADNIVVLCLGGSGAVCRSPEAVVVAGRTGLRDK